VLMTEYAPRERRGFFAALPFLGIQLGTVFASLVYLSFCWGSRTSPRPGFGVSRFSSVTSLLLLRFTCVRTLWNLPRSPSWKPVTRRLRILEMQGSGHGSPLQLTWRCLLWESAKKG
jgi:endonuclease/exonuclease/phosphatase (EEP) superfamily protein YafD